MTPPATAAGRPTTRRSARGTRSAVRHPRRISGPSRSGGSVAAAVAIPAPGIALPRQRPQRPAVKPRRRAARKPTRRTQGTPGIALRAIDVFEGVSGSALLDRLIRGRVWIGLLACSLIGMVAMQLLVLELNTGIGRKLTRVAALQRENAQLGIEDSTSSAEGRVAPTAAAAGMILAPVGTVHFVAVSPTDVARAAAALSAAVQTPSSAFASSSSSSGEEAKGKSTEPSSSASSRTEESNSAAGTPETASTSGSKPEPEPTSTTSAGTAASTATGTSTQANGASSVSSSESGASSTQTSESGGGTPAGPRE